MGTFRYFSSHNWKSACELMSWPMCIACGTFPQMTTKFVQKVGIPIYRRYWKTYIVVGLSTYVPVVLILKLLTFALWTMQLNSLKISFNCKDHLIMNLKLHMLVPTFVDTSICSKVLIRFKIWQFLKMYWKDLTPNATPNTIKLLWCHQMKRVHFFFYHHCTIKLACTIFIFCFSGRMWQQLWS